ncbi:flagellin [Mesorhizobium sp. YM1C-6-2]|uniref:flagellin N-terminal helical domain-containing protein n=1 Tax=Mesorhizobium sp. YM1C-6-2 TaxID=1827501 RepID=UPI000EF1FE88|nr:flagellin [Mesorhizobium sp. YM1C-6-2]RLP26146.1 flagellin [Mesorhizobium sp. YM1C-6-2]
MASIMTNASALTALQTLNATNKTLAVTQARISTGYRVAEASDNAAYWSIATTMRSDHKALSTVQDSLGLGASKVDTAYTGMNKAIDIVNDIKVKLVAANGASAADKAKIQVEIKALQGQLKSYADAATFSGANFLSVTSDKTAAGAAAGTADAVQQDIKIVASFNRSASGSVSLGTIDVKIEGIKLFDNGAAAAVKNDGILDRTTSIWSSTAAQAAYDTTYATTVAGGGTDTAAHTAAATAAGTADNTATSIAGISVHNLDITASGVTDGFITSMIAKVEGALKDMTNAATNLGAAKNRIDLQKTFTTSLMDSIERGVGQLVDADMNKESTRLQALQVQQQLGIQALSIANGNSQSILSLFRG